MVGDEDQSIYGFRGAYPQAILSFKNDYKNSTVLLMETNYRSSTEILSFANRFIRLNKHREKKQIIPFKTNKGLIKKIIFKSIDEQYDYIIKKIKNLSKNENLAILYRNNDSSIPIINILTNKNISFSIKESDSNFFSNYLINDIRLFIKFFFEPYNLEVFKKIYYKINCGISKNLIKKLEKEYSNNKSRTVLDKLISLNEIMYWQRKKLKEINLELLLWRRKNSYEIVKSILSNFQYENYLKTRKVDKNSNNQKLNVLYSIAKQETKLEAFYNKLFELEKLAKKGLKTNQNIILSTVHGSKGLEFDNVIIVDVINGILPSVEKIENENSENYMKYEEEIRLFYVAITRAKKNLEILSYESAHENATEISEFLLQ